MGAESGDRVPPQSEIQQFEEEAANTQPGFASEFLNFLFHNKKWWLAPILFVLLLIGFLVVLAGTPAAPFIYTLF